MAQAFLSPAPEKIVNQLRQSGQITAVQAQLAAKVPMADAICVEADSGGHTDMGVAAALMPAILQLRDQMKNDHDYGQNVFVGSAGGIGTPEAASAAFILGADFILTGSINQCTVEAGTSDMVKDLLQLMNVQDTDYAPAGDMFELGASVQVLKKRLFFPGRAALSGDADHKVNFQVHTGPALGAFNQWVKGTDLEPWKKRHVAQLGKNLMMPRPPYLTDALIK